MALKLTAAPASNDQFVFSEDFGTVAAGGLPGFTTSLNVRANDGKAKAFPLYSLDNGQSADLATADPISNATDSRDRSQLGAAIWINANGTVGYSTVPIGAMIEALAVGETLQDSFLYATRHNNGSLLWSTVTIAITGTNDVPVAMWDSATVSEDALVSGSVATNDLDVDKNAVLRFATADAAHGFALSSDGIWVLDASNAAYQDLALGETKTIAIGYTVTDQHGAAASAVLTLTVTGGNDGPVTYAATAAVNEDGSLAGALVATDADRGDVLRYALAGEAPDGFVLAANGAWTFDAGMADYQALPAGEMLTLIVSYTVTDQAGASAASTLTIFVTGTNDVPVASAVVGSVNEDSLLIGQLAATDADGGTTLSYALIGDAPAGLSLATDGGWKFDASDAAYQALGEGETTAISAVYSVSDGEGGTSSATLTLNIIGSNDGPVLGSAASLAGGVEDTAYTVTAAQLLAGWSDADGDSLSVVDLVATNATVVANPDGSYTLVPNANYHGAVVLSYGVSDGITVADASLGLDLVAVNDAPLLAASSAIVPNGYEDSAIRVTRQQMLQGWSDVEGSALSVVNVTSSAGRVVANADGSYSVVPDANWNGTLQLRYDVSDGSAATATSLDLTFASVNDWPRLSGAAYVIPGQTEDVSFTISAAQLLQGWSDADGDALQIWTISTAGGQVTNNGDGTFTVRPAANATGAATLNYTVYDGKITINSSLSYTLQAVNDPAVITGNLTGAIAEDAFSNSIWGQLYASDVDNPSNSFVYVSSTAATYGSFSLTAQGRWTYFLNNANPAVNTLDDGQTLTENFTFRSIDGTMQSVTVTIHGLSDNAYVSPTVSTAADANDFDGLNAAGTKPSTLFNFYATGADEALDGSNGNDNIYAQGGSDTVYGHAGSDGLFGEIGPGTGPSLLGVAGTDSLYGQAGNDTLQGGQSDDRLYGGSGNDTLYGNNTQDQYADSGADVLYGGSGDDRLYGQGGDDVLIGGTGADWLTGGAGADRFAYLGAQDTGDWIFDFQRGADRIDLSALGLTPANFVGAIAPGYVGPGEVGFRTYMGGSQIETFVYVDTDGVAGADLEIRLISVNGVDANDFAW